MQALLVMFILIRLLLLFLKHFRWHILSMKSLGFLVKLISFVSNLKLYFIQRKLQDLNITAQVILEKCQETVNSFRKKKKVSNLFKKTILLVRLVSQFNLNLHEVNNCGLESPHHLQLIFWNETTCCLKEERVFKNLVNWIVFSFFEGLVFSRLACTWWKVIDW